MAESEKKPVERFDPSWCRTKEGVDTKEKFIQSNAREKPGFYRGARVTKRSTT